jgi:hypothetical protein
MSLDNRFLMFQSNIVLLHKGQVDEEVTLNTECTTFLYLSWKTALLSYTKDKSQHLLFYTGVKSHLSPLKKTH